MPSSQTPNYQLSQWERSDKVQMEDFNADNAKIDTVLGTLATQVSTKAEQSALTAEVKARTALAGQVAKLGNCQIYCTTYTGDGNQTRTLTFPHKPLLFKAICENFVVQAIRGGPHSVSLITGQVSGSTCAIEWSGNSITWTYTQQQHYNPNLKDRVYYVVVLMDAGD